jgi:hypothetical protein
MYVIDDNDSDFQSRIIPKKGGVKCIVKDISVKVINPKEGKKPYNAIEVQVQEVGTENYATLQFAEPEAISEKAPKEEINKFSSKIRSIKHFFGAFSSKKLTFVYGAEGMCTYEYVLATCTKQIGDNDESEKTGLEIIKSTEVILKLVYKGTFPQLAGVPPFISSKLRPFEFEFNPQYDIYTIEAIKKDDGTGAGTGDSAAKNNNNPAYGGGSQW